MIDNHRRYNFLSNFIIGASTGWLVGLSASPIVSSVVGILIGAIAGYLTQKKENNIVDARPLAILMIGLAVAAPAGILVRTSEILNLKPDGSKSALEAVLYSSGTTSCLRLLGSPDNQLISALQTAEAQWARELSQQNYSIPRLREAVRKICE